jgi:hypothetical protein
MILCELGQAWKGAAAADDSCAGMWLEARHPNLPQYFTFNSFVLSSLEPTLFVSPCDVSSLNVSALNKAFTITTIELS